LKFPAPSIDIWFKIKNASGSVDVSVSMGIYNLHIFSISNAFFLRKYIQKPYRNLTETLQKTYRNTKEFLIRSPTYPGTILIKGWGKGLIDSR